MDQDVNMDMEMDLDMYPVYSKGGQTAILVRWSAAQWTTGTEMLADQQTEKNSGPAPAHYRNWASASPLLNYLREAIFLAGSGIIW
jgi:hypothetical protein